MENFKDNAKESMEEKHAFLFKSELKHYNAEFFVVRCFDDRFRDTFNAFMEHINAGNIDPESVAGGAKIFSSPEKEGDADFMTRELEKSIKLHHTKKVILMTHHDCGAYGGFAKFNGDRKAEIEFHRAEHDKARSLIKAKFPDLEEVRSYFIDDEGVIELA